MGVVRSVGDLDTIMTKTTNKEIPKRDLTICDDSEYEIRLTLWNRDATEYVNDDETHVVLVKQAKVGDFGGMCMVSKSR